VKHRLRELLACPWCGSWPLDLVVFESELAPAQIENRCVSYCSSTSSFIHDGDPGRPCADCYGVEITQGVLRCAGCRRDYPIVDGVARFNPDALTDHPGFSARYQHDLRRASGTETEAFAATHARTKRSFGYQWLRHDVTDDDENRAHFYRRTDTVPGGLSGELVFEAGCGMGRYLRVVGTEPGAEVVGLDVSEAVDRAYSENRFNPCVHVVQGDVLQPPLRPRIFDRVFSIGALHHTPDTALAFGQIVPLLKPGGRVAIWVYHAWCPTGRRGLKGTHARLKGWISGVLRRITTRLPHPVLHYLCYLAVPVGRLQLAIQRSPAPLRALLSPCLLLFCSTHPRWQVRVCDTFDWYSPQYQHLHTVDEVAAWFREAGLEEISTAGFPVTVRGCCPASNHQRAQPAEEMSRASL
jgi:SAM-dependent methyltransferase/uncharacterized protein YbaR (Trm112 family)